MNNQEIITKYYDDVQMRIQYTIHRHKRWLVTHPIDEIMSFMCEAVKSLDSNKLQTKNIVYYLAKICVYRYIDHWRLTHGYRKNGYEDFNTCEFIAGEIYHKPKYDNVEWEDTRANIVAIFEHPKYKRIVIEHLLPRIEGKHYSTIKEMSIKLNLCESRIFAILANDIKPMIKKFMLNLEE